MDGEPRGPWLHLLMTLISVAGMASIMWMEMPESERAMISLNIRAWLHRNLHRNAQRAGHAGMGAELHEHYPSASLGYGLAYRLSQWRDRI